MPDRILILSALYGLLPLDRLIVPYELRMGLPGSITAGQLRQQAERLHLVDGRRDFDRRIREHLNYARIALRQAGR